MGEERKIVQNAVFRGKRHDNRILKVQIVLSRNYVVIAQAPNYNSNRHPMQHLYCDCVVASVEKVV